MLIATAIVIRNSAGKLLASAHVVGGQLKSIISNEDGIRSSLGSWLTLGLHDWTGTGMDKKRRFTRVNHPEFAERLAAHIRQQTGLCVDVVQQDQTLYRGELTMQAQPPVEFVSTGIASVDDVLGGGFARGSVTLLSGYAGIGKTTLAMQAMHAVSLRGEAAFIYSAEQAREALIAVSQRLSRPRGELIRFRDRRAYRTDGDNLTELFEEVRHLELKPSLLVVDSLQTIADSWQAQLTAATQLQEFAIEQQMAVVLISHLNKRGEIWGSRSVEHLADVHAQLDYGDDSGDIIISTPTQNRFAPCNKKAHLKLTKNGLAEG